MHSGLYYPHTTVRNESILKTALLLWDRLEFIVPWEGFRPKYPSKDIAEAMELIGIPISPNESEKAEAHTRIEELIARALPPQFYISPDEKHGLDYEMYSRKLGDETWRMLVKSRLAGAGAKIPGYMMEKATGLTLMSILADCCAGETKCRVTDMGAAYATLSGILGGKSEESKELFSEPEIGLVPIALKLIDASSIDLRKLIDFRRRENIEAGVTLRDLRHSYIDDMEGYVKRLCKVKTHARDTEEIEREFSKRVDSDLQNLKTELQLARNEAILSKEFFLTVLASVGSAAALAVGVSFPILGAVSTAGVPASIVGLLGARNKYLSARRNTLLNHPMAYLFELQRTMHR